MFWMPRNKWCVYSHHVDGVCIYIGMGTADRPFTIIKRSKKWVELTKHGFFVDVLSWHGSKNQAREAETALIKQHKPICNSLHTGRPGRKHTEEDRIEMSKRLKERWKNNPNMRAGIRKATLPVKCIETGIVYIGLRAAAKATGLCPSHISQAINGYVPHAGGYHFTREI